MRRRDLGYAEALGYIIEPDAVLVYIDHAASVEFEQAARIWADALAERIEQRRAVEQAEEQAGGEAGTPLLDRPARRAAVITAGIAACAAIGAMVALPAGPPPVSPQANAGPPAVTSGSAPPPLSPGGPSTPDRPGPAGPITTATTAQPMVTTTSARSVVTVTAPPTSTPASTAETPTTPASEPTSPSPPPSCVNLVCQALVMLAG